MDRHYLPVGNDFDVLVSNLRDAETETPVTNAVLTCTLYDVTDEAIEGASSISLSHKGSGDYRGTVSPTEDLTADDYYKIVITSSNYNYRRMEWVPAREVTLEM